jgi:hypothetical protein
MFDHQVPILVIVRWVIMITVSLRSELGNWRGWDRISGSSEAEKVMLWWRRDRDAGHSCGSGKAWRKGHGVAITSLGVGNEEVILGSSY